MAELSVPGIEFEITADGSAAIQELEKTAEAAEKVADAATDLGSGADGLEELGSAAQQAGSEMQTAAKGAQEFGKQAEAGAKKASASLKEIGEKMSSIGKGMTMAVSVPIVGALAASVSGASDLTETLGKTDVVFGELTDGAAPQIFDLSRGSRPIGRPSRPFGAARLGAQLVEQFRRVDGPGPADGAGHGRHLRREVARPGGAGKSALKGRPRRFKSKI